jgi:hypothetical protein
VSQETRSDEGEEYRYNYSPNRFESLGGDLTQGKPVEVARDTIPAGVERRWGFGSAEFEANQGYAFGQFENADGEQIHGQLIFVWENSTGRETQVVTEVDTRDIDTTDRYNRDMQVPIPEQNNKNKAVQDQSMVVLFEAETDPADITNDYAIDASTSQFRFPATEYDVS